jgi:hypothetical protein
VRTICFFSQAALWGKKELGKFCTTEVGPMQEQREELIRLARENGLPVPPDATVTEVVRLLSAEPYFAPKLSEALDCILHAVAKAAEKR